jgi:hypothetical protein
MADIARNCIVSTRLVLALSVGTILVMSLLAPINFANATPGDKPSTKVFTSHENIPRHSKLIVNVHYKVTNDEDSGFVGYWALDNYEKHIMIWADPKDGSYWAIARYEGTFTTFAGALSPQNGVQESSDATGHFVGGYTLHFTGTFNPKIATHGDLGTFDFGGTKSDILLGSYGNGQTGNSGTTFNVLSQYFTGENDINFYWGWAYAYKDQMWTNFVTGSSGDIIA